MHDDLDIDLGPCCTCGQEKPDVRNIVLIEKKAPVPGSGWGCVVCDLPMDGALAVVCDTCVGLPLREVVHGHAVDKMRCPVEKLTGEHRHDERIDHDAG